VSGCGDDDVMSPSTDAGADASPRDASIDASDASEVVDAADATTPTPDAAPPDLSGCADGDGDGHASADCGGDDCDDGDATRYPSATEECDGDDEDCNDATYGPDADADGFEDSACCNGADNCGADCNDTLDTVNPSAGERCNAGVDDDCDGLADTADGVCVPCATGYAGLDGDCVDIDECVTSGFCGVGGAACTNLPGTFVCSCSTGYVVASPTGGLCVNIDECAAPSNPCGVGTCADNAGSYLCSCPAGYRLAMSPALTCTDIDECADGTDACTSAPVAACMNQAGTYLCTCPSGYEGTGRGVAGCADIDECTRGTDDCDDANSVCTNTVSSFSCGCRAGFIGTGRAAGSCRWNDPALATLTLGPGARLSPAFNPATTTYTLSLAPGATSGAFTVTVAQPSRTTITAGGTALASGGSRPVTLTRFAPTVISVVVTTETGATRTYTLIVGRGSSFLKASNTGAGDGFGGALALSHDGNVLAVAARAESSNATGVGGAQSDDSANRAGAVYVFRRTGSTWAQEAYVKASNTDARDTFGASVALSSDGATLVVGATGEASNATSIGGNQADDSAPNTGAVYVFRRTVTTWAQEAYVKASNSAGNDSFGGALALSADGSRLAVGAPLEDSDANGVGGSQADDSAADAGAVYVFLRTGTTWAQEAYVKATNSETQDYFGDQIALSSDGALLAVGARYEGSNATGVGGDQSNNAAPYAGAVYLYRRSGTAWAPEAYVKASNPNANDYFGCSVALSPDGSTLAVGAWAEDSAATGVGGSQSDNSLLTAGAAYVFRRIAGVWAQEAYIKASNTEEFENFGWSVALSVDGNMLAVGARIEDSNAVGVGGDQTDNSAISAGAVYVFRRTAGVWSQEAYVKSSNTDASDLNNSVQLSSDGVTLAFGAPLEDSNATGVDGDQTSNASADSGAAYVY